MKDKNYGAYEVLLGIFNNFPVSSRMYTHNEENFNRFFYNNRDKYIVLNNLAFDAEGIFPISKELAEAHSHLIESRFLKGYDINPKVEHLHKSLVNMSFMMFSQQKFNQSELKELEQLSLEFQKEFC
jgi:hypothetical protein